MGRHVGDLGNIDVDDEGIADIKIEDHKVKMSGADSVIGKAIVIHADMDDLGRGGDGQYHNWECWSKGSLLRHYRDPHHPIPAQPLLLSSRESKKKNKLTTIGDFAF